MRDIEGDYGDFWEGLLLEADASGDPQQACFFRIYAEAASDNGDCEDLTYTPIRREGAQGYQVDGYAIDPDRGELHLAVCDFRPDRTLDSLNQAHIDTLFRRCERFLQVARNPEFLNRLEETSPAFELAYPIHQYSEQIRRVRFILFSNSHLVARKKGVDSRVIDGRTYTYNLLDFTRYSDILAAKGGSEPIELDICSLHGEPLPCLEAHTGSGNYRSYLAVIPGKLLAELYGLYGARLLEQNVRTFLQARTKVNKGIINTVENAPEMFFAYNNGLTATASGIEIETLAGGNPGIATVTNLQIVNGGQTTASILYARDRSQASLDDVFVQMKLSVVDAEDVETVVPRISRFANTQNRISEADFFSNHPFHIEMEKVSRRLPAPQRAGAFSSTKWFYERARGQYKDAKAYGTPAVRRKFETEFPKDQVIVKTELAKYAMTFECRPDLVSQGAQKCFLAFAEGVSRKWEGHPDHFNEAYFKETIAKAIVFRWTDRAIGRADWYIADRGYKANIVTYAIAWLVNQLKKDGRHLDLQRIWSQQDLDDHLKDALMHVAIEVARVIKNAPPEIKNISEYCKRQLCWTRVCELKLDLAADLSRCIIDRGEERLRQRDAVAVKKIDNEIEFERKLVNNIANALKIRASAQEMGLLSPKADSGLRKLGAANLRMSNAEKAALKVLFERIEEEGVAME